MKALSVRQPWAGLIAAGRKTIETRSRPTRYRGELLICASRVVSSEGARLHPAAALLPLGAAVARVQLVECRRLEPGDAEAAMIYRPGLWAWILADARPVEPFFVSGRLGFFEVPA